MGLWVAGGVGKVAELRRDFDAARPPTSRDCATPALRHHLAVSTSLQYKTYTRSQRNVTEDSMA